MKKLTGMTLLLGVVLTLGINRLRAGTLDQACVVSGSV